MNWISRLVARRHAGTPAGGRRSRLAIELKPDQICYARVTDPEDSASGKPKVDRVGRIKHVGQGPDAKVSIATLRQIKRSGLFDDADLHIILSSRQRQISLVARPAVEPDELKDAVRWTLKESLEYSIEDAVVDVVALPTEASTGTRPSVLGQPSGAQVMAFAVRRSWLKEQLEAFLELKLIPNSVGVVDDAQRNLARFWRGPTRAVAAMTRHETAILLTVSRGWDLALTRSFELRASDLQGPLDPASDAAAERIGLQLQRSLDAIERRQPQFSPSEILVPESDPLLQRIGELSGLRRGSVSVRSLFDWDTAVLDIEDEVELDSQFQSVLGGVLRDEPSSRVAQ